MKNSVHNGKIHLELTKVVQSRKCLSFIEKLCGERVKESGKKKFKYPIFTIKVMHNA